MKHTVHIVLKLAVCVLALQAGHLYANGLETREYELKAAYIYNILKFVELPEIHRTDDKGEELKIVSVGVSDKELLTIFKDVIGGKEISQRKDRYKIEVEYVDVKVLADENKKEELDVLFIKNTTRYDPREILGPCDEHSILTVGETKGFLESGGMINFQIEDRKLRFEINNASAKQAKVWISSALLRLAKRVISEKSEDGKGK